MVIRALAVVAGTTALLVSAAQVSAQTPDPNESPDLERPRVYRTTGARVAIGRSIRIAADEEVTDAVVVVGGSLRIDGRVRDGVVVIGGDVDLGPQSDVRGDVVLVGGRLTRASGAQLRGSVSDVSFGDWGTWSWGGFTVPRVRFGEFGGWLSLFGAMFRISLLAILMAIVLLVARAPVARVGQAAAAEPGRAFLLGLLAEVLFVPALIIACIGLIVTIIGIPLVVLLVPVSLLLGFAAFMLGFTGLACRLGEWVEDRLGWRGHSALVATMVGLLLIIAPTLAARVVDVAPSPVSIGAWSLLVTGVALEFIVWTIGLGATLMTGFGRWSTSPPPLPPVAPSGAVTVVG